MLLVIFLACIFLFYLLVGKLWFSLAVSFVVYVLAGGWRQIVTLPRDFHFIVGTVKCLKVLKKMFSEGTTIVQLFEKTVTSFPEKTMLLFEGKEYSFRAANEQAEKIATYFQKLGLEKGDCVALFMENSPDLAIFWMGLAKIGVISALVNYNLRGKALSHSIKICNPKIVICSFSFRQALLEIASDIPQASQCLFHSPGFLKNDDLDNQMDTHEILNEEIGYVRPALKISDIILYIYTSGTTGFPKAAKITNYKFINTSILVGVYKDINEKDVIWSPLPLYHSSAGVLALGQCISFGATIAFRTKFSAKKFWADIVESQATVTQYVGEICRYVYNQPECPEEKLHNLRLIYGNGLRKDLWMPFKTRFRIPHILEFYGSTEGNNGSLNIDETPGAVGFLSIILPHSIVKTYLVKCDEEGKLVRDKNGLCVRVQPGSYGVSVGEIRKDLPTKFFDGYLHEGETSRKIECDVIKKGDKCFVSGDVMFMDLFGYLFFSHRLGDNFRWKAENVSSSEVESVLLPSCNYSDVIVYGVEVPHCEGRAGMAAILDPDRVIGTGKLSEAVQALPSYARPVFIRMLANIEQHITGTFKLRKIDLQKEGFDINNVKDPIFYWSVKSKCYEELTQDVYQDLLNGTLLL